MADEQLFRSPDVPVPPNVDEEEQYAVMQEAAKQRGGLREGEDLTALPTGTAPPTGNWKSARTVVAPGSGNTYDIYTRDPEPAPAVPSDSDSSAPPPGIDALKDIDDNFSPDPPDDTVTKCAEGFAEGFVEGFAVGYAVGFVLGALGPVGAVIGVGLLLYSAYQVVTNWDRIKAAPPEEKAKMIGGLAGGILGGGLGGRAGSQFRETVTDVPPSTPVGRSGSPLEVEPGTNSPTTIEGREYSGHALDRMQGRGIPPSAVENTIENGQSMPGNQPGTTQYYDPDNNLTVVTNSQNGRVVTVRQGPP